MLEYYYWVAMRPQPNALAYTTYLLALNPDIQEKLQSEIDSYFKEKPVRFFQS